MTSYVVVVYRSFDRRMMDQFILPLLLALLFVPLFLSFRKQRRQYNQMQQLQSSLQVGDRVMTTSGLQGIIVETTDDTVDLEIAPGVITTWVRQAVRERLEDPAEAADSANPVDPAESEPVPNEADKR
jgi:preprotein translocase subunit YajC